MSFYATAEHEKEKLQHFASPEGRDDLYQYNQKERRTVLEVNNDDVASSMLPKIMQDLRGAVTKTYFLLQPIIFATYQSVIYNLHLFVGTRRFSICANAIWVVGTASPSAKEKSFFYIFLSLGPSESSASNC